MEKSKLNDGKRIVVQAKAGPVVEEIDRSQNNLETLDELKQYLCKGLLEANLSINLLKSPIGLPISIKKLNLSMNRFTDVRSFSNFPNLQWLDLSLNQISSLEGIDLPSVEFLNLSSNNLTRLKGLDNCRGLSILKVDRNKLKSIMVPSGVAQLQVFSAAENLIEDIKEVEISPILALRELDLSKNKLSNVGFLARLTELEVLNLSGNRIANITLSKEIELTWLYALDVSANKLQTLTGIEINFPGLTVLDVSNNGISDENEFECLIYMNSVAELELEGNPCFEPKTEDYWHDRFDFLERINKRRFYSVGERERREMEKVCKDMLERQLVTHTELDQMNKEIEERHRFDDELVLDEPEGEYDIVQHSIFKKNRVLGEEFARNDGYLKEFGQTYAEDFHYIQQEFYEHSSKVSESLLDGKQSVNSSLLDIGAAPIFAPDELKAPILVTNLGRIQSGKPDSEVETRETDQSKLTPHTVESKKEPSDLRANGSSVFDQKHKSPVMLGEIKTNKFRLRTYSRDLDVSKKSEATSHQTVHTKLNVNWAQKDLKKQNEEIMRMLERTRKDLAPLQRVPHRTLKQVPSANRLGG